MPADLHKREAQPADIVKDVYSTGSQSALNSFYKDWAIDYDADVVGRMGYNAPSEASMVLAAWLSDHDARILDAGAGTGLVGEALNRMGYRRVDALDASREMLDVAAAKQVYGALIEAELGPKPLAIPDQRYDAVICVGTFTFGHVKADALDGLYRVVRPGGIFCFTHRTDVFADPEMGFADKQAEMERRGAWWLLHKSEPAAYLPRVDPGITYQTWVYRKAEPRAGNGAQR